jgi:phenylacetate-CoA ligase
MFDSLSDAVIARAPISAMSAFYRHTPPAVARAAGLHRFRQVVRYAAKHSPFYRKAFHDRGIHAADVRTPADLGDFFTTPDQLVADPESFLCRPPNIVFESSGTSGTNKRVFYSRGEMHAIGKSFAAGFGMMGVTPADRVANAFDFNIWSPGHMCHAGLMASGHFCQAFGKVDPGEVYRRLKQGRFTVVLGEPTWLIRLTQLAEADGGGHLRFLIGGAEEMPADAIPWMRKVWNGATVKMCYSTVEMGATIAFQPCDNHDGYHLDTFDFLPETTGVGDDGYGELVFTTLYRRTMPLIRYRTRDSVRLDDKPCRCGLPAVRMSKVRGRLDELVVASGGNLYPKMFEDILRPVPGLTLEWQVVFLLEGIREVVEVHVETDRTDVAEIDAEIRRSATEQFPDLMRNLALGIFDLRVVPQRPGTVRTARKLKRLVDRRHF